MEAMGKKDRSFGQKCAYWYLRIKASVWYPLIIIGSTIGWMASNHWWNWDPGLVILLTWLSVDASVVAALIQRDQAALEAIVLKQLRYIQDMVVAMKALLEQKDKE